MHAKVFSATTVGINAHSVEVEADLSMGMLKFFIVGLPDKAIQESKDRVRAAFKNSGLRLPERLITVNLAPASLKKEDILFDVPIAVAILQAAKLLEMQKDFIQETLFLGELALDGSIRSVCGVLSIVHSAQLDDIFKLNLTAISQQLVNPQQLTEIDTVRTVVSKVELNKKVNTEKATSGDVLTYTLTATNTGSSVMMPIEINLDGIAINEPLQEMF